MSNNTPAQKLVKARANLIMGQPFFGTLALRMKMIEDKTLKTGSCDGVAIRYNPDYVDKMTLAQAQGFVAHSVMHPGMLHHTRRGNRPKDKWNEACDYSINGILTKSGFTLPDGRFTNPAYDGMTAEHIYTLLPPSPPKIGPGQGQGQGGGSGENGDDQGQGQPNDDPGGDGGVEDSPNSQNSGSSASQQAGEEAEWKVAMAQAAHVAKQRGKLPADIERMMEELFEPILPWKNILRRFMTEKSNDDFSWARGNRRFIAQGLYLPSRVNQDNMGTMVVAVDTSGSIQQQQLDEFGAEIRDIHQELKPTKLVIIYCDAEVAHVDVFGPHDELSFKIHGGGGTDFRPPFEYLRENQIEPKCFVYLTDGYGPFPEREPDFPTMWCINNHDVTPPYGEHLVLEV